MSLGADLSLLPALCRRRDRQLPIDEWGWLPLFRTESRGSPETRRPGNTGRPSGRPVRCQ